jgi:hypothetical protein
MELNDIRIKSIIRDYSDEISDKEALINLFRKETELYIYNFPRLAYGKNPDFCADFYLYVLDRLEGIIRNYPIGEDLKFKTWFNYVLKNQMINFYYYQTKDETKEIPLDGLEEQFCVEILGTEEAEIDEVKEGLLRLPEIDKIVLKLYYMPEMVDFHEIRTAATHFKFSVGEILVIRRNLILANLAEIRRIREISEKLSEINRKICEVKYALYKNQALDIKSKNDYLVKLARMEGSRFKLLNRLKIPEKRIFDEFVNLFRNIRKAHYCLNIAKKKLKFEILRIIKSKEEGK